MFSYLSSRVADARATLVAIQESILAKNSRQELGAMEKEVARKFNMLAMMGEIMTRHNAKVCWLELGDRNTTYFFRNLKRRHNRYAISSLTHGDGVILSYLTEVKVESVRYFSSLFSSTQRLVPLDEELIRSVIRNYVSGEQDQRLSMMVTTYEIRDVMFQ